MSRFHPLLASTLLLVMLPVIAAPTGKEPTKKLYCWNENGHKVCGDALPATAVNSARTEISERSGMATGQVERALTMDERAAAAAKAEADRQAASISEAKQRRDMAMVESYASEGDLRRAYENRIELSEGTVKASRLGVAGLRQVLLSLLRRAGASELGGQAVAKPLATDIQRQHAELLRQEQMLVQQEADRGAIETEFLDSLARYRAMKTPATANAPVTAGNG